MAFWNRSKPEQRASVEDPSVPISSANVFQIFGLDSISATGINVTIDKAMGIPAIWAAVNFISGTIAGLPLKVYRKTEDGREEVRGGLSTILHGAWNDETSSFDGRKYSMERVLTAGRSVTYIERNAMGRVINLWPLNPENVIVARKSGRKVYTYQENGDKFTYSAAEIIDIPFSLCSDILTARSPILANKDVIGLGIAATQYGNKFFQGGGVPPFVMTGNFNSPGAMKRASDDLEKAVRDASKEGRSAITIPSGHEVKSIGADPDKTQLVELKRFQIEEYARIYSLPPTFLQDLSHGTFSNTEQQDLHFVKHTVKRWVEQIEQEMNLKLFGKNNTRQYVEFNLDGLLRGDFATRMKGYATAIQNAIRTPDEVRKLENLPSTGGEAGKLHIQGATVPLGSQSTQQTPPAAPAEE